jgi:3-oxoadipate enol-lactonase / 4-carboxymuconolactone decarboxylase
MTAVEVHAVVEGPPDAPVVLLAGSLGSTLAMWDPQLPALAARFRVVRYDTRGHGGSPVPEGPYALDDLVDDAVALLDRLGVARAHVVGLSLGGMTALRLASREPHRVDRLVVLCTSAALGPASAWAERAATVRARGAAAVAEAVVQRWFTAPLRAAEPALVQRMERMVAGTPAAGYAGCCAAIETMDLRADLARITAPTLAVAGEDDPATPPEHLAAIADAVPGGRLLVLPQSAHLANVEQPTAVSAALLTHLDPAGGTAHDRGMQVRRSVLGDAHVDRAVAGTTRLTAPFQDLITRYAWGDVWSRPGLDRRSRSMLTLALLTALGSEQELRMHVRAAVTNGLTSDEIGEVLLHTAVYAGVPAANSALAAAQEVLAELGLDGPAAPAPPDPQGPAPAAPPPGPSPRKDDMTAPDPDRLGPLPWSGDRTVLPLLPLEGELGERVRELGAKQVNLYRSLAHAPQLLHAWIDWAWALRDRCATPRSLRELMILRTAVVMRSAYEWHQHVAMAQDAGVTDEQIEAVAAWQTSQLYDAPQRAALMLTDAMLTGHVPDAVHDELARHFTDAEKVELVLTAGCYTMVPRVLDACRVPVEGTETSSEDVGGGG